MIPSQQHSDFSCEVVAHLPTNLSQDKLGYLNIYVFYDLTMDLPELWDKVS